MAVLCRACSPACGAGHPRGDLSGPAAAGRPLRSMSPGLRLRLRPPPLLTRKGLPATTGLGLRNGLALPGFGEDGEDGVFGDIGQEAGAAGGFPADEAQAAGAGFLVQAHQVQQMAGLQPGRQVHR